MFLRDLHIARLTLEVYIYADFNIAKSLLGKDKREINAR